LRESRFLIDKYSKPVTGNIGYFAMGKKSIAVVALPVFWEEISPASATGRWLWR